MRATAEELLARSPNPVDARFVDLGSPLNYEVVLKPASPRSARISWLVWGGNYIVSSGRCEWQSEDWLWHEHPHEEDEDEWLRRGLEWSENLVRRISRHGAAFVRLGGRAPRFLRETGAVVGDELPTAPFERLESWEPW